MNVLNPRPTTPSTPSKPSQQEQSSFRRSLAQQSIGMLAAGGYFSPSLAKQLLTSDHANAVAAPVARRAAPMLVGRQAAADRCPDTVCCA